MLSDSFMDALEDKAVAPKRPKIVRKKLTPSQPSKPPPSEETVFLTSLTFTDFPFFKFIYVYVEIFYVFFL